MIHNIRFREFVYESENLDELTQAIYNIFPDAEIESEDAEGLMEVDEKITIVDSGDSIHLKVKIAAYPAKKEIAIKKVREAIENN